MRFDFQLQFIIIFLSACFVRSKTISSYEKLCSSLHLRLRKKKQQKRKTVAESKNYRKLAVRENCE